MNSAVYIEITATKGSVPRDAGTAMKVTYVDTLGTIGGGMLEHQAIAEAHKMLATDAPDMTRIIPLGPNLGQCCGGSVTLLFTRQPRPLDTVKSPSQITVPYGAKRPLWIWGAGHVGRAVVRQATSLNAFDITWIDSTRSRFPTPKPADVTTLPASDMRRVMPYAPTDALHLIMTYSHDIDLALCAAALKHRFAYCGLIGSATKWARFSKRLTAIALDPSPITCPIGDPALGKHPDQIAAGTLKALLVDHSQEAIA